MLVHNASIWCMCRLPPIETRYTPGHKRDAFLNRGYTFQCPAWKRCKLEEKVLTKVYRSSHYRRNGLAKVKMRTRWGWILGGGGQRTRLVIAREGELQSMYLLC